MRSSAATFEAGLDLPARRKARKKRAPVSAKRKGRKRAPLHVLARYAAITAGMAIALGIMVNALMLQKGHHPAPLFGKAPAPIRVVAQAPKASPAPHAVVEPSRAPDAESTPAPASVQEKVRAADPTPAGDDVIGRLLRTGTVPGGGERSGHVLSSAQRALGKLGFAVKATGTMDAATRRAIEAFDKAHHLPVKGELDRKTIRLLAAASGTRID